MAILLEYDVGSLSIKARFMEVEIGIVVETATSPKKDLEIIEMNS